MTKLTFKLKDTTCLTQVEEIHFLSILQGAHINFRVLPIFMEDFVETEIEASSIDEVTVLRILQLDKLSAECIFYQIFKLLIRRRGVSFPSSLVHTHVEAYMLILSIDSPACLIPAGLHLKPHDSNVLMYHGY